MNPYQVTKDFEKMLCDYTGSKYAVALNSGTAALLLSCIWCKVDEVFIPCKTYVSVPNAVKLAGGKVRFYPVYWEGEYQLHPYPIWDSARRFTSGMYKEGQFQCVSFATTKILGIEQGGAILHDNLEADDWFRKMRFDGRTEGRDPLDEDFTVVGHHCIMLPSIAAQLTLKLHHLPKDNDDLPWYNYPDLSRFKIWT
jgi:dTDP-4-amino-4,6-dideoxygalactose transaminase